MSALDLEKAADRVPAQPRGYGLVVLHDDVLGVVCLEAVPEGGVHAGRAEGGYRPICCR